MDYEQVWHPGTPATPAKATSYCGNYFQVRIDDYGNPGFGDGSSWDGGVDTTWRKSNGLGTSSSSVKHYNWSYWNGLQWYILTPNCTAFFPPGGNEVRKGATYGASCTSYGSGSCPKGWGTRRSGSGNGTSDGSRYTGYSSGTNGYYENRPVYGYVTRYRDAWHNYYCTRVAKA